jgi:hypothetical protein
VANCGSDPAHAGEVPKISDEQMVANSDWVAEAHNAWPAIAARLVLLEEFARRVRKASRFRDDISVAGTVLLSIDWLDEAEKAGES